MVSSIAAAGSLDILTAGEITDKLRRASMELKHLIYPSGEGYCLMCRMVSVRDPLELLSEPLTGDTLKFDGHTRQRCWIMCPFIDHPW